jgi:DNA-binding transcriptional regulator YdaS (Cro superfamily)
VPDAVRKVDRSAWAAEVARLVREEADGNKSAFARMVGLKTVKTVDRWLAGDVEVSQSSVLMVCRALKIAPITMLIRVGLMTADEIRPVVEYKFGELEEERDAQAMAMIQSADVPPHLKRELLEHLRARQVEHERQRLAEVERMLGLVQRNEPRAG